MIIGSKQVKGMDFITLENETGMEVVLCDYGAGIYQIKIDGQPMLNGLKDYEEWMKDSAYHGKCIGRIAGRIQKGELSFEGKTYQISKNEGENTLHGGKRGFSFQKFKTDIAQEKDSVRVDFYYDSPDGDEGFPGEVTLRVRYILFKKKNTLRIEFKCQADRDTPMDITVHTYFDLGGEKNILGHELSIDADEILAYDDELIPQKYVEIPSFMDLRKGKPIGKVIENDYFSKLGGLDTAFHKLDRNKKTPHIVLTGKKYKVDIYSSYDDAVIFTSNCPPFGMEMNNGNIQEKHSSVAIEPQYEALDFPRMMVKKKEIQNNFIEYRFERKDDEK